ncbi:hypothetical protein [Caloranaerobacter azorensis]|uniref:Lipoprotein n=1 Tax=Caloranaerobacter azorensis TaxID=116090 RepID=A0A6P1YA83_9FIRM|nr:hypothetical protein [Caloranaerobacter azorensis]QIB26091.1 hypothetical protein G3A45_01465 [Caloranaerobacter azorensis]
MDKKILLIFTVLLTLSLLITGCSNTSKENKTTNETLEEQQVNLEETNQSEKKETSEIKIEPVDIPGTYEIKNTQTIEDYMYIYDDDEVKGKQITYDLLITKELGKDEMLQIAKFLENKEEAIEVIVDFYSKYTADDPLENLKNRLERIALRKGKIVDLDSLGKGKIKYLTDYEYLNN